MELRQFPIHKIDCLAQLARSASGMRTFTVSPFIHSQNQFATGY
ncbi:unnamed protein product [Tenebrio molitor]|nr:unnamed protein product [Tenebrio molitor]